MRKTPKIIVCLLLFLTVFTLTACGNKATEQEAETVTVDGVKYSIIERLENGKVTSKYAKVLEYSGSAENVAVPAAVKNVAVTHIGGLAFYEKGIKSLTLPEGLTTIENFACGYSELITVEIPSSVTDIGDYAFINCLALKEVVIKSAAKPKVGQYSFKFYNESTKKYVVRSDLKITVPSLDAYKPASKNDYWTDYQSNIKEAA